LYEKQFKRDPGNSDLLEKISYASVAQLKNMVKYLNVLSDSKDEKELCILADMKTALGLYDSKQNTRILTERQREAIVSHLIDDKTQAEVAESMGISQQGVSLLISGGLKRMKKYLVEGNVNWIPWTDEEKAFLLSNYNVLGPDKCADKLNKEKSKVISMYHALKNKQA
jgi:DNA-directed RNA polymerase specialized sigma subunit